MSGFILHQTNDLLVIVTDNRRKLHNRKTGRMLQVYILVREVSPIQAILTGQDAIVCGACKLRGTFQTRRCYVRIDTAPQSVWRAYRRGKYPFLPRCRYPEVFYGRRTRLGAYGDPGLIPLEILRWIVFFSERHTAYTHMWETLPPGYRELLMASVDSPEEREQATLAGWRTFRTRVPGQALLDHEIACPASNEAGHRTTCLKCCLCDGGTAADPRKTLAIYAHGVGARNFNQLIQIGGL